MWRRRCLLSPLTVFKGPRLTPQRAFSQRIVMEQLVKDFPEVPFIAEESIEPPKGVRMASVSDTGDILEGTFWTVDPIDG
eukprot:9839001-Prorocentrum_lima.AAC.1